MGRVIAAFLTAPLLGGVLFMGLIGLAAYPFLLLVALLLGGPIFLLCRKFAWLSWFHAALVGAVCSVVGICTDLNSPVRAELFGPAEIVLFVTMGCAVGLSFWFMALFRNPSFPQIDRRFPRSLLVMAPVFAMAWFAHERVATFDIRARLVKSEGSPAAVGEQRRTVNMALASGAIIAVELLDEKPLPARGTCAFVVGRRSSIFSDAKRYWVLGYEDDSNCQFGKPKS
ncbi:MAG TPA: hypothetical protein VGM81_20230 [Burkholderiaceae bacterium]|jgi:hypothetical protein